MRIYDAVFFDAANTLLYPYPSVGEVYAQVARRYGVETTGERVQRAFRQVWGPVEAQAEQDPVRYGIGEPDGRRFWHAMVHATFAEIGLPEDFETFFDELYWLFAQPAVWRLFPECLDVLQTLRQQGYIVGIISNWDNRLLRLLEEMGLMTYVQHVSISALVGWEKPHGAIFQHATTAVSVAPARALHIGDNVKADAQGAQQAGLQPLWLQRQGGTHADYPVIHDLRGVLTWLERTAGGPPRTTLHQGQGHA
ncbi:MAG: HAD-IA family hydrolase [Candidatus Tectimicrobiota bacterium]